MKLRGVEAPLKSLRVSSSSRGVRRAVGLAMVPSPSFYAGERESMASCPIIVHAAVTPPVNAHGSSHPKGPSSSPRRRDQEAPGSLRRTGGSPNEMEGDLRDEKSGSGARRRAHGAGAPSKRHAEPTSARHREDRLRDARCAPPEVPGLSGTTGSSQSRAPRRIRGAPSV